MNSSSSYYAEVWQDEQDVCLPCTVSVIRLDLGERGADIVTYKVNYHSAQRARYCSMPSACQGKCISGLNDFSASLVMPGPWFRLSEVSGCDF